MDETKKWYQSKAVWGAIVAMIVTLLNSAGIDISGEQSNIVDVIMQLVGSIGAAIAIYGRIVAKAKIAK